MALGGTQSHVRSQSSEFLDSMGKIFIDTNQPIQPTNADSAIVRSRFNARLFGCDLMKNGAISHHPKKPSVIVTTVNRWIQPTTSIYGYFMSKVSKISVSVISEIRNS